MPLPGANVILPGTNPLVGTTTDLEGWFVLERVPLGRHDIQASFLGYRTSVIPQVLVTAGSEVVLRIQLDEQIVTGEEIVITPESQRERPLNEYAVVSARSFSVEETRRYAGGLDDPARMASAFAGVTTGGGIQENAMIIRGNAPKGVQWRLEGIEIPNPSHFAGLSVAGGGGLTLFSTRLLADGDFLTGAFPAEFGNALAGVFDVSFRSGNRAQREHALQVGVLGIEAASEGPIETGAASTYLFNYRYSTLGLLLPILPTEDVATYQDLSFKLSFPTRRAGRFELWGLGGIDGQSMSATEDSSKWEYETWDRLDSDLDLAIGAAGLSHTAILSPSTLLKSTLAATVNRTRLDQRRLGDDLVLREDLALHTTDGRLVLRTDLNHKFSARQTNRTGITVQRIFFDLDVSAAVSPQQPVRTVAAGRGASTLLQAYTQSKIDVARSLSIDLGIHLQHFSLTNRTSVEPRTAIRWAVSPGNAVSAGYGLHSQIEDLRIYLAEPAAGGERPNRDLGFSRAHHFVIGYDRALGQTARLKLETYYQYLFDVPVIPESSYSLINFEQDFEFREALSNEGTGRNYGIELTAERFLQDGFYALLTGSLFRSTYEGGDGIRRPTRFDRGFAVNALFGKEIQIGGDDLLGINGRINLIGGERQSPVDTRASLANEDVIYDERRAFEDKLPPLFIVDLTVTYRRNHSRTSEVWALQVKNLLAAKETLLDYNFGTRSVEEVREGFPLPVLSYKLEF